jgi:hypothetical protein
MSSTRGLRNCNPGNIRHDCTKWQGEVAAKDKAFKTFGSMAYGYRAMFVVLNTYQKKYGLRTIRQMIERWAPPVENDTDSYIATVSRLSNIGADAAVTSTNRDVMIPIVAAMSRVENGKPAVMADVEAGWELFIKNKA